MVAMKIETVVLTFLIGNSFLTFLDVVSMVEDLVVWYGTSGYCSRCDGEEGCKCSVNFQDRFLDIYYLFTYA